jgi:hypothetical protein
MKRRTSDVALQDRLKTSMADRYCPPEASVGGGHVETKRIAHAVIVFASGLVFWVLVVFCFSLYVKADPADIKYLRIAVMLLLPCLLSACVVLPFRRLPAWAAALVGPVLTTLLFVGLAFAVLKIDDEFPSLLD